VKNLLISLNHEPNLASHINICAAARKMKRKRLDSGESADSCVSSPQTSTAITAQTSTAIMLGLLCVSSPQISSAIMSE